MEDNRSKGVTLLGWILILSNSYVVVHKFFLKKISIGFVHMALHILSPMSAKLDGVFLLLGEKAAGFQDYTLYAWMAVLVICGFGILGLKNPARIIVILLSLTQFGTYLYYFLQKYPRWSQIQELIVSGSAHYPIIFSGLYFLFLLHPNVKVQFRPEKVEKVP